MWPDDLVDVVHREVVDRTASERADVARIARTRAPLAPSTVLDGVVDRVLARTVGLGPLEPLLADPSVTEVMVNGPGPVWIERGGELEATPVHVDHSVIVPAMTMLRGATLTICVPART